MTYPPPLGGASRSLLIFNPKSALSLSCLIQKIPRPYPHGFTFLGNALADDGDRYQGLIVLISSPESVLTVDKKPQFMAY
jgi:hypothetical protein